MTSGLPEPPWVESVFEPATMTELADCVRANNHRAIFPLGARSWLDLGYPPSRAGVGVSTLNLNRVVEYPHEELTITVEAGIRISDLSRILAEKRQMLPFDCPHPDRATLGGLLATNTSGPRRLAYGTARDSVLGLDVIDATGIRVHGGGRVVKNVAGYDLPKMHIGALGTLGIIAEATIKVRPVPEAVVEMDFGVPRDRLSGFLTDLRASTLRPTSVEIQLPQAGDQDWWAVMLLFTDVKEAVARQTEAAETLGKRYSPRVFVNEGWAANHVIQLSVDQLGEERGNMAARIGVLPTEVGRLLIELSLGLPRPVLKAYPASGIIWALWEAPRSQEAERHIGAIRSLLSACRGSFSLPRCFDDWKRRLPIWGDFGPEIRWMQRLRDSLDPNHVLNPGRFVVE